MARVSCVSEVGKDGTNYITVFVEEPYINKNNLWEGGKCLSFNNDFKKNTCTVYQFYYSNGVPVGFDKAIKTFKDEILTEKECIAFADELHMIGAIINGKSNNL